MKKVFSFILCIVMILTVSMTASAGYRDPVDGIKMSAGLNPVIMKIDDTHFQYAVYAVDMENMTNADMVITYPRNMIVESFEEVDKFDLCYDNTVGTKTYVSFLYKDTCYYSVVKLFVINFKYTGEFEAPELELSTLAGTFIKKVHEPVIVEYDGKNELPEKILPGDVDLNGKITAADARLALRFSAKLEKLTDAQQKNAEVNKDGKVTSADARKILRVSAGLEKGFADE
ncbi:MAG: dockerin type I repeat-containing protein [Clostridia bacterium]|nr:dockerin type I repeat-containing protein [Clostridia bacterium]